MDYLLGIHRRRKQKKFEVEVLTAEKEKPFGQNVVQAEVAMDVDRNKEENSSEQTPQENPSRDIANEMPFKTGNLVQESTKDPAETLLGDSKGMRMDSSNSSLPPPCEIKDACLNSSSHSHSSDGHAHVDNIISSIPKLDLNCKGFRMKLVK